MLRWKRIGKVQNTDLNLPFENRQSHCTTMDRSKTLRRFVHHGAELVGSQSQSTKACLEPQSPQRLPLRRRYCFAGIKFTVAVENRFVDTWPRNSNAIASVNERREVTTNDHRILWVFRFPQPRKDTRIAAHRVDPFENHCHQSQLHGVLFPHDRFGSGHRSFVANLCGYPTARDPIADPLSTFHSFHWPHSQPMKISFLPGWPHM